MIDIKGYEGLYAVTKDGKVWSHRNKKFLKACEASGGYLLVQLCNKGHCKTFLVHRLVAEAYIPNPDNLPFVNHKDENKQNPDASNLEWCTSLYNNNYGTRKSRDAAHKTGKTLSAETKQKISDALKLAHARRRAQLVEQMT